MHECNVTQEAVAALQAINHLRTMALQYCSFDHGASIEFVETILQSHHLKELCLCDDTVYEGNTAAENTFLGIKGWTALGQAFLNRNNSIEELALNCPLSVRGWRVLSSVLLAPEQP
jgi:hypothetical protein